MGVYPGAGRSKTDAKLFPFAWLVDFSNNQVWVWQGDALPAVYTNDQVLPTLGNIPSLTTRDVVAMARQRR